MIELSYIIKELLTERTRLILTILAIAWGTASIAIMLSVGEGLRLTFGQAMAGVGNNILVVRGGQASHNFQGQAINQIIKLTQQDLQTLQQAIPAIKITPEYTFNARLAFKDKHRNDSFISAVNPIYANLRNINMADGRFINELDNQNLAKVIVLGTHTATMLFGKNNNPVGKFVQLSNQPFQVIGVIKKKLQMWSYQYPDIYLNWIPANTYIAMANPTFINNLIVVANDSAKLPLIKQQIQQIIARNHALDPNDKSIVIFQDSHIVQAKSNRVFNGMEIFLGLVGVLNLAIAGVGIANVMLISIRRATREIGIRMAIGARTYHILLHYIMEALLTTAIGGIIGLVTAKIIISLINLIPLKSKVFSFIGRPHPVLSWLVMMIVITVLGTVGFLAGLFPATKAANINPAEALRHE